MDVAVTVTFWVLVIPVLGEMYFIDGPVEALRDPGPVSLHVTPLEDLSLVTVAVKATDNPRSIACCDVGDRPTVIGGEDEHPLRTNATATNATTRHKRTPNILSLPAP